MAAALQPEDLRLEAVYGGGIVIRGKVPAAAVRPVIRITPAQLAAGRAAFLKQRGRLSDLYDFFDEDLSVMLRAVFRAMEAA